VVGPALRLEQVLALDAGPGASTRTGLALWNSPQGRPDHRPGELSPEPAVGFAEDPGPGRA
jgi:hypothetical protein